MKHVNSFLSVIPCIAKLKLNISTYHPYSFVQTNMYSNKKLIRKICNEKYYVRNIVINLLRKIILQQPLVGFLQNKNFRFLVKCSRKQHLTLVFLLSSLTFLPAPLYNIPTSHWDSYTHIFEQCIIIQLYFCAIYLIGTYLLIWIRALPLFLFPNKGH